MAQKTTSKRSRKIVYRDSDNKTRKLYAMAVDKYFSSVTDKNKRFRALSPKEEREVIKKYAKDRQMMEKILTEHNIFMAINFASRQSYRFTDYDELISLAMNGLREAATTFDPDKGFRFNTWAAFYLKKNVLKQFYVKKESYIDNNVGVYLDSNTSTVSDENSHEYNYATMKNHVEPNIEEKFNDTFVDKIERDESEDRMKNIASQIIRTVETSSLSVTDKTVFNKSFINGLSIDKISKELGLSRSVITHSKERVITFINEKFDKSSIFG